MEFTTINEYFYKLFTRLLMMLMLPIIAFIYFHMRVPDTTRNATIADSVTTYVIPSVVCLWLIALVFSIKKIKSARKGQGLRAKLEKYFRLTIVRYILLTIACVILAVAFGLTLNNNFTYAFLVHMIVGAATWPHPPRVAKELRLRGDEREMVYYRKDSL